MKRLLLLVVLVGCEAAVEEPRVRFSTASQRVEVVEPVAVEKPQEPIQDEPVAFQKATGNCLDCAAIKLVPPPQGDPHTTPEKIAPYVSTFTITVPAGEFVAGECATCAAVNGRNLTLASVYGSGCDRHWSYQTADCTVTATAYFSESGGQCVMNAVLSFSGIGRGGESIFYYQSAPQPAGSFAVGTPIPCAFVSGATKHVGGRVKCRSAGTVVAVTLR